MYKTRVAVEILTLMATIGRNIYFSNFIFGSASDLYLCLYNQLFALFHYIFKVLTP